MENPTTHRDKTLEVVAGILWRGEHYLAVQRPEGKAQAGWWEFPGGKVERGEETSAALIRELAEELGVQATEPRFWQSVEHGYASTAPHSGSIATLPASQPAPKTDPTVAGNAALPVAQAGPCANARRVHVHFYHVRTFSGEPSPCEGQSLRWVTPAEALHLPFLAADVPIVEHLHSLAERKNDSGKQREGFMPRG